MIFYGIGMRTPFSRLILRRKRGSSFAPSALPVDRSKIHPAEKEKAYRHRVNIQNGPEGLLASWPVYLRRLLHSD
jgi:hypothetical protein